jgi:methyl-accepting chemotaxis protein
VIGELVAALYQTQAQISQVEVALTEMTDLSRGINQISRQQAQASEQAVQNLQNIDIIARQSATSSIEVSHTAQEIEGLGQELNLALVV